MNNKIELYCCDLFIDFHQNDDGLLITYLNIDDSEHTTIVSARATGLTKAQISEAKAVALKAMRQKLNDEIDRLIKEVADDNI